MGERESQKYNKGGQVKGVKDGGVEIGKGKGCRKGLGGGGKRRYH